MSATGGSPKNAQRLTVACALVTLYQLREQPLKAPRPVTLDQHFRIGARPEPASEALQFATQIPKVVYRAIKYDVHGLIFGKHWLATGL